MRRAKLGAALCAALMGATLPSEAGATGSFVADPATSRLEFTGTQAGAPFTGVFHKFTASIDFSPDALAAAKFDVVIDLSSEDTRDKDRDGTIRGADVFDIAHFPAAHYVARSFSKTAAGYAAVGSLTLRGVTKDVPIAFKFSQNPDGGAALSGSAELKRLDFGVGQGDWKSTEWVADAVKVSFTLNLKAKP